MPRHTIKLPKLGDTAEDAVVLEWLVAEGGQVAEGDALLQVETSKVDAEVPAPIAGVVLQHLVAVDDEIPVGTAICVIES
jgi:pyruvate/2-oxoglutarate dehydrogenase complex dihydrolipoamide acyltransferase (E2) component